MKTTLLFLLFAISCVHTTIFSMKEAPRLQCVLHHQYAGQTCYKEISVSGRRVYCFNFKGDGEIWDLASGKPVLVYTLSCGRLVYEFFEYEDEEGKQLFVALVRTDTLNLKAPGYENYKLCVFKDEGGGTHLVGRELYIAEGTYGVDCVILFQTREGMLGVNLKGSPEVSGTWRIYPHYPEEGKIEYVKKGGFA